MKRIKITFDPDGAYGYPEDEIIKAKDLVSDYIEGLNEVEDADTISFLKSIETEKAVDFVAQMWGLDYEYIPDDMVVRKCSQCGRQMTEGYVFDGTDCFCSYDCAADFFDGDRGCVEIMIDESERLKWEEHLPKAIHYKVNIGHDDTNLFHYCDSWQKVLDWINANVYPTIKTEADIDAYNEQHKFAPIEYIVFLPENYYSQRKEYAACVRKCNDIMLRCQCIARSPKRDRLFREFSRIYNDANDLWDMHPEVWQGEI